MAFWTNGSVHIKQKNKFVVSIGEFLIPTVVSCDKPKVTIEKHEYTMINQVYRYPGIAKWQPITIKFVDGSGESNENKNAAPDTQPEDLRSVPIAGIDNLDAAQMLYNILLGSGYAKPKRGRDSSTTKASMMDLSFKGSVRIEQIESDGKTVSEGWRLINPIVTEVNWGGLDYGSTDAVEYSVTIEYDYAEMYIGENKVAGGYYTLSEKESLRTITKDEHADLKLIQNRNVSAGDSGEPVDTTEGADQIGTGTDPELDEVLGTNGRSRSSN